MEIKQILTNIFKDSDREYRVANSKGEVVCNSPLYDEISQNAVEYNNTIFRFKDTYYEVSMRTIELDDVYSVVELQNVTRYILRIEGLKEDKVTTLPNRSEVEKSLANAHKSDKPLLFVICDIDDFKKVNDQYGHQTGDDVLNELGTIFIENMRENDFVGRYGGEEFLMIFRTDKFRIVDERLSKMREEIQSRISNKIVPQNLTFSAGISLFQPGDEVSEVLRNADQALYYVKANGKNGNALFELIESRIPKK